MVTRLRKNADYDAQQEFFTNIGQMKREKFMSYGIFAILFLLVAVLVSFSVTWFVEQPSDIYSMIFVCFAGVILSTIVIGFPVVIAFFFILQRPFMGYPDGYFSGQLTLAQFFNGTVEIRPYTEIRSIRYRNRAAGPNIIQVSFPDYIEITTMDGKETKVSDIPDLKGVWKYLEVMVMKNNPNSKKTKPLEILAQELAVKAIQAKEEERKRIETETPQRRIKIKKKETKAQAYERMYCQQPEKKKKTYKKDEYL